MHHPHRSGEATRPALVHWLRLPLPISSVQTMRRAGLKRIFPLVVIGPEFVVHKHTIAYRARLVLERKGNKVAETTGRHRVLTGEKQIIGIKTDIRVSVHRRRHGSAPRRRASEAETGSVKKSQAWAPLPERERSIATEIPNVRAVSQNAATSRIHDALSKSAARNQQVSSGSMGYTPTVKSS